MSAPPLPRPDGELSTADHVSRNGAASELSVERVYRTVVLGYITAVAIPPVGLILGVILVIRPATANAKHGAWIIVLSIIAAVVWVLLLSSGVINSTNVDGS